MNLSEVSLLVGIVLKTLPYKLTFRNPRVKYITSPCDNNNTYISTSKLINAIQHNTSIITIHNTNNVTSLITKETCDFLDHSEKNSTMIC